MKLNNQSNIRNLNHDYYTIINALDDLSTVEALDDLSSQKEKSEKIKIISLALDAITKNENIPDLSMLPDDVQVSLKDMEIKRTVFEIIPELKKKLEKELTVKLVDLAKKCEKSINKVLNGSKIKNANEDPEKVLLLFSYIKDKNYDKLKVALEKFHVTFAFYDPIFIRNFIDSNDWQVLQILCEVFNEYSVISGMMMYYPVNLPTKMKILTQLKETIEKSNNEEFKKKANEQVLTFEKYIEEINIFLNSLKARRFIQL